MERCFDLETKLVQRSKKGIICCGEQYSQTDILWEIFKDVLDLDATTKSLPIQKINHLELYDHCRKDDDDAQEEYVFFKPAQILPVLEEVQELIQSCPNFEEMTIQRLVAEAVRDENESMQYGSTDIPSDLRLTLESSGALSMIPMSLEDRSARLRSAIALANQSLESSSSKKRKRTTAGRGASYYGYDDDYDEEDYDEFGGRINRDSRMTCDIRNIASQMANICDLIDFYNTRMKARGYSYLRELSAFLSAMNTNATADDDCIVVYHSVI